MIPEISTKNKNFKTKNGNSEWRYHHFTQVYEKS